MDSVSLSVSELCFAILVESHADVCHSLFDFVVHAVRARHPTDWMDRLSAGLGSDLSTPLKLGLQKNLRQKDIYLVCKLLRYRINDIACWCGGEFINPNVKERLCLQVQAVETARHWVFHGDQHVSPAEVRSSVSVLVNLLTTFLCKWTKMSCVADNLSRLIQQAEKLTSPNPVGECSLNSDTIVSTLVWTSLAELKNNFEEMLTEAKSSEDDQATASNSSQAKHAAGDFTSLFKNIRKAISERPKDKHFRQAFYIAACKNVQKARNTLAHNPPLTLSSAKQVLVEIRSLLEHFKLAKAQTTSALEKIKLVSSGKGEGCLFHCTPEHESKPFPMSDERERILRPKCDFFIGRQEEILSIEAALEVEGQSRRQVVLIFGPAGVGKSYLATHATRSLSYVYNKQTWLSCSSAHELLQDMSCAGLSSNNRRRSQSQLKDDYMPSSDQSHSSGTQSSRLVVLDDVSSSTMHLVLQLINENNNKGVFITTRSTAVKLFFKENIRLLHFIELKAFSLAESWSLLGEKVSVADLATQDRASIDKILIGHLENLPLCVGIYSSWLASTTRRKRRKGCDDCHGTNSIVNYEIPCLDWREFEECFGDRFHVRGLTGVVQAAEGYLEDHPLVVLLLTKICIVDDICIPWEVIRKSYRWTRYDIEPELRKLVSCLLGLADWLFSDSGQETLVLCRDALEELGLIRWECYTATIHVHGLTLQGMQQMLTANTLFLGYRNDALIWNEQNSDGREASSTGADIVCRCISEELLLQVSCRGVVLLKQASAKELSEEQTEELSSYTWSFLLKLVQNKSPKTLSVTTLQLLSSKLRFRACRALLAYSLLCQNTQLGVSLTDECAMRLIEIYEDSPQDIEELAEVTCRRHLIEGTNLQFEGFHKLASERYQHALAIAEKRFGCNSEKAMWLHSLIAICLDKKESLTASKDYLNTATTKCPRLRTEPTPFLILREILKLHKLGLEADIDFHLFSQEAIERVETWEMLTELQAKCNDKDGHCVNEKLTVAIKLLITLRQERQRLLIEKINSDRHQQQYDSTSAMVGLCHSLIREVASEMRLWMRGQKLSPALRGQVKAIRLVANKLKSFDENQMIVTQLIDEFTELLGLLLDDSFFRIGHFSLPTTLLTELLESKKRRTCLFKAHGQDQPLDTMNGDLRPQTISKVQVGCASGGFEQMTQLTEWMESTLHLYKQLQTSYEKKDFQASLTGLVSCLEYIYNLPAKTHLDLKHLVNAHLIVDIVTLLPCVEKLSRRQAAKILDRLSHEHSIPPGSQIVKLFCRITEMDTPDHQPNFEEMFAGTTKLLATGDRPVLWEASLKCWEKICESGFLAEMKKERDGGFAFLSLSQVFVFEQAKMLQQLYAEEGRYNAAEWFAKFCFQFAKEMGWGFLAGKYGAQYAQFLKERGRDSEAMEQCQAVLFDLVEDFGEDYLEWLPDAPEAALILEDFEKETGTNLVP